MCIRDSIDTTKDRVLVNKEGYNSVYDAIVWTEVYTICDGIELRLKWWVIGLYTAAVSEQKTFYNIE